MSRSISIAHSQSPDNRPYVATPNALLLVSAINVDACGVKSCYVPSVYKVHFHNLGKVKKLQELLYQIAQSSVMGGAGYMVKDCFSAFPVTFSTQSKLCRSSRMVMSAMNLSMRHTASTDADERIQRFMLERGLTLDGDSLYNFMYDVAHKHNYDASTLYGLEMFLGLASGLGVPMLLADMNWELQTLAQQHAYAEKHLPMLGAGQIEAAYKCMRA